MEKVTVDLPFKTFLTQRMSLLERQEHSLNSYFILKKKKGSLSLFPSGLCAYMLHIVPIYMYIYS